MREVSFFYVQYHSQTTHIVDLYRFIVVIAKVNNELYLFSIREKVVFFVDISRVLCIIRYNLIEMI